MSTTRTAAVVTAAVLSAGAAGFGAAHATADTPAVAHPHIVTAQGAERWAGANRYATAATISQQVWTRDDAVVVFLATGTDYPDALALGASTVGAGPILFVKGADLTDATRAELRRLAPCEVVAVGGEGAVPTSVLNEAAAWTTTASPKCSA
jgi:putative cell wall-binding protein